MATAVIATSRLRLVFQVGMDDDGKPLLKAKTFSNIQKSATADQLFQAAVGPLFIGYLYDMAHSWTLPILTLILVSVVVVVFGMLSGRNRYV